MENGWGGGGEQLLGSPPLLPLPPKTFDPVRSLFSAFPVALLSSNIFIPLLTTTCQTNLFAQEKPT